MFIFLIYLLVEVFWLKRRTAGFSLRICVTGTRGKSSVTRLIAAVLRESGYRVLAKTTGSRAVLIGPDGDERELIRHGAPSVLEAKKILKIGGQLRTRALVLELMGILPESVFVESVRILRPHILVVTNVREDHVAQMGSTKKEIASCFASAIPEGCTVIVPQDECYPAFLSVARRRDSQLVRVNSDAFKSFLNDNKEERVPFEFENNIGLALAVSKHLGLSEEVALRAMSHTLPDYGGLKVWVSDESPSTPSWLFVSAFAANDPESTRMAFSVLRRKKLLEGRRVIGLLNFRNDRGDRTIQWIDALNNNDFPELDRIILLGHHAVAVRRRLKDVGKGRFQAWPNLTTEKTVKQLMDQEKKAAVLIGMGNMRGAGQSFVDFWEKTGKRYDG